MIKELSELSLGTVFQSEGAAARIRFDGRCLEKELTKEAWKTFPLIE